MACAHVFAHHYAGGVAKAYEEYESDVFKGAEYGHGSVVLVAEVGENNAEQKRSEPPKSLVYYDGRGFGVVFGNGTLIKAEQLLYGGDEHVVLYSRYREYQYGAGPCGYDGGQRRAAYAHFRHTERAEYEAIVHECVEDCGDERHIHGQLYVLGRAQHYAEYHIYAGGKVGPAGDAQICGARFYYVRLAVEYPDHTLREKQAYYEKQRGYKAY